MNSGCREVIDGFSNLIITKNAQIIDKIVEKINLFLNIFVRVIS